MRHVAASEPSQAGRQDPEPRDPWQCRSTPEQGGRIQSRGIRDNIRALPSREAGSGAVGHVAVCLPCLGLKPVCGGTWSARYRYLHSSNLQRKRLQEMSHGLEYAIGAMEKACIDLKNIVNSVTLKWKVDESSFRMLDIADLY
jgi:hypothetical protein